MKEEDVADESEPVQSSTLIEKEKTAMSKVVKEIASLCSIYDVNFKNVTREHEFSVSSDLS